MLTLNDGRSELWQWDTNRKLTVDDECSQIHFSNKVFGRSIDVDVVDGVVTIPDILLQTDKDLNVWAFIGTPENGYTKISKVFKVNRRNKPADYVFTPPEQTTLAEIMERLDDLEAIQDPDAIKNAVDDYLANNPITVKETDPTVPEWAKQPNPPDVKIPDKLPNPYSITFTGAVNASYDGSNAVEIKIPDSGGNADQGGGLNATASALLITILRNVSFYATDQSANIAALEAALASGGSAGGDSGGTETVKYTVTNNLTNVTSNNSATTVAENAAYTATLTAADGYELDSVTVTMGGVDVTSEVVKNGIVVITAVTGNIVITATAKIAGLLYSLPSPFVATGTGGGLNTGVNPVDNANDSATWIVELKDYSGNGMYALFSCRNISNNHLLTVWQKTNDVIIRTLAGDKTVSVTVGSEFVMQMVYSYDATTKALSYFVKADTEATGEIDLSSYEITDMTATTFIGAMGIGTSSGGYELPNGTISRFEIYGRAFNADEMAAVFN